MKQLGKKTLNVDIPLDLFTMYSKLCVDLGITKTQGIIQYFRYLKKQYHHHRQVLNEKSKSEFRIDEGNTE